MFDSATATLDFPPGRSTRLAEITNVPGPHAKVVLSPAHVAFTNGLILAPAGVGLVGGLTLIATGLAFAGANQAVTGACVFAGLALGVGCILVLLRHQHYLASNYQFKVVRRTFEQRTGCLVNPGDPNARFLEIIPRSNLGKWGPANDVALLSIDTAGRRLVMEGDARRYAIPFEAIASCEVEAVRLDSDQWGTDQYFVVVLTVNTDTGPRELPLATKPLTFATRRMPQRQAEAEELCETICQAMASA